MKPGSCITLMALAMGWTSIAGAQMHVDRTVEIEAYDTMRFSVSELAVRPGETIRFVVKNKGRLQHEFSIGTIEEQEQHASKMRDNPGLQHDEPNSLLLGPRQRKEMIWHFDGKSRFEIACMVPGHYEAGMIVPLLYVTSDPVRDEPPPSR